MPPVTVDRVWGINGIMLLIRITGEIIRGLILDSRPIDKFGVEFFNCKRPPHEFGRFRLRRILKCNWTMIREHGHVSSEDPMTILS